MIGAIYIDYDKIGEVNFEIIDETMGCIGGQLIANDNYKKYQINIQSHCGYKGIANITDFNLKVRLSDNTKLNPQGGIGITDIKGFEEIYVEVSGLDLTIFKQ
jgi:hypothetical protein